MNYCFQNSTDNTDTLSYRIVVTQDCDSSLTPSWKECAHNLAFSSPQICGDDLSLVLGILKAITIRQLSYIHPLIEKILASR